jgi:carboxyl-terminal processing protease
MYTSLRLRAQRQKRYRCQNRRKNYNTFKTRKGTVYDGGGILPDLQLEESKLSTIANALIKMTAYSIMQQTIIIKPNLGNQT